MAGKIVDVTLRLIDKISSPLNAVGASLKDSSKQWIRTGKEIEKVGSNISAVGGKLTTAITVPVASMGVAAVQNFGNVDKTLKLVESTMGDTKWATGDLEGALKKAAANSVFTMDEAADATLNFARQGFDAKKSAEMLEPALSLAAGTATDLSEVTSGLGNTLKVFESQELTASDAANIFAQAQAQANTTTSDLFEAMSVGSSIFKTVGWSMQDLAAVTDVFGDNFISGSEGATAMKTGLARLVSPAKDGAAWIEKLGLNVTNADGTMKSMVEVQGQLHDAFAGLTQEQQMQAASAIFGKNQMGKWLTLINTAPETVQNYRNSLDDLDGTANGMADSLMSGVGGSIEKLKSTFDVFTYSIGSNLAGPAQKGIDKITGMIDAFNNMEPAMQKDIVKMALMAASAGPAITVFGKMVSGIGGTVTNIGKFGDKLKVLQGNASDAGKILKTIQMPKLKMPKGIGTVFSKLGKSITSPIKTVGSTVGKKLFGPIIAGASKAKGPISILGKTFGKLAKAPLKIYTPFTKGAQVLGKTGKALFALLGPAGTAVVAVGAIVAAGILLYKNWDKVTENAKKLGEWVKKIFKACGIDIKGFVGEAGGSFSKFIGKAQELWTLVSPIIHKVGEVFSVVLKGYLAAAVGGAIGVLGSLLKSVTEVFSGITKIFSGIIDFIVGVFTGNWEKAWTGVKEIFGGIFESLVALAKAPINAVISIINGAIAGINNMGITIPDWVPGLGGKDFHVNIPTIPMLYSGTNDWKGGPAMIHDRGAEIVDLPSGTRVYPHDKSLRKAYQDGAASKGRTGVVIEKIADTIVFKKEEDMDKFIDKFAKKLEEIQNNGGGNDDGYIPELG